MPWLSRPAIQSGSHGATATLSAVSGGAFTRLEVPALYTEPDEGSSLHALTVQATLQHSGFATSGSDHRRVRPRFSQGDDDGDTAGAGAPGDPPGLLPERVAGSRLERSPRGPYALAQFLRSVGGRREPSGGLEPSPPTPESHSVRPACLGPSQKGAVGAGLECGGRRSVTHEHGSRSARPGRERSADPPVRR